LDWRAKVELFEQIRREYEFGIGTIAGVAKKVGVHRRMVREAIGSALPKLRKKTERPRWKLAFGNSASTARIVASVTRQALVSVATDITSGST
jgi:2-methylcitrate dehydratase PrpD